jgi:SSS family solute:Na+ symporter
MILGFVTAVGLEFAYGGHLPFGYGLTSGCFGLAVNLLVYVACAYLLPHSAEERQRVEELFAVVQARRARQAGTSPQARPALA